MNILVAQRRSKTANNSFSLSVEARIIGLIDFLQTENLASYTVAYADDAHIANILKWADVIIISRNLSNYELNLIHKAKAKGKKIILDIDDYLFSKPSYSQQAEFSERNIDILSKNVSLIDHIVVSNKILYDELLLYGINSTVVKTRANIQNRHLKKKTGASLKYVYTTTDNVKLNSFKQDFIQMLQDFHAEFKSVKMVVYSDVIYDIISLPFVEWFPRMHYQDYMRSLSKGNYLFSVIPLGGDEDSEDALFHACKSPVKYFDYGLAKIPGIYSDVPIYNRCINHGKTGFLVKNDCNEWYKTMKLLYNDESLRSSIAENAYAHVRKKYDIKDSAYEYYKVLKSVTANNAKKEESLNGSK